MIVFLTFIYFGERFQYLILKMSKKVEFFNQLIILQSETNIFMLTDIEQILMQLSDF